MTPLQNHSLGGSDFIVPEICLGTMTFGEQTGEADAHAQLDYPERDDVHWMKHTLWYSEGDRLDYKPVRTEPLTVETFKPKPRTF